MSGSEPPTRDRSRSPASGGRAATADSTRVEVECLACGGTFPFAATRRCAVTCAFCVEIAELRAELRRSLALLGATERLSLVHQLIQVRLRVRHLTRGRQVRFRTLEQPSASPPE